MSGLRGRLARLEQALTPDRFAGMVEFTFSMSTEPLPAGTEVPQEAHVVADFFEIFSSPDWGSRRGVAFRSGYRRQRIATDPDDHGRLRPASEDPANQLLADNPQPAEPANEFQLPDHIVGCRGAD